MVKRVISMPHACISCDHYQHKGKKHDSECPFTSLWTRPDRKSKTHYGNCQKHQCQVFGTQLCNSHTYPIELMDVHPVKNRSKPLEPFQEQLL